MHLLLDECIDERLRFLFSGHTCHSARYAGLAGLKNGELLLAAEARRSGAIITVDQNMPDQQNLASVSLSLLILCAPTNRLIDLQRLVPTALGVLDSIKPGQAVKIR